MVSQATLNRAKKFISNTPLNRNYIADLLLRKRLAEAAPYVQGLVLDVGCGEKQYEDVFQSRVKSYIGVDLPTSYLPTRHADVYGDACLLPFKSNSFDAVICTEVLPHVEAPHLAFAEFARVLKCNGTLIVTANKSWNKRQATLIPDYWRFTDEGLVQLSRQQKLAVIYTKAGGGFFAMMGQLFSRFMNLEFIHHKNLYKGNDQQPNIVFACLVLPLCALIQLFSLFLDRLYSSKIDTLFYILVAVKREAENFPIPR